MPKLTITISLSNQKAITAPGTSSGSVLKLKLKVSPKGLSHLTLSRHIFKNVKFKLLPKNFSNATGFQKKNRGLFVAPASTSRAPRSLNALVLFICIQ
jgi:hypothetical protein